MLWLVHDSRVLTKFARLERHSWEISLSKVCRFGKVLASTLHFWTFLEFHTDSCISQIQYRAFFSSTFQFPFSRIPLFNSTNNKIKIFVIIKVEMIYMNLIFISCITTRKLYTYGTKLVVHGWVYSKRISVFSFFFFFSNKFCHHYIIDHTT